jgi:nucleoside-diphosphate-sugar epimerase
VCPALEHAGWKVRRVVRAADRARTGDAPAIEIGDLAAVEDWAPVLENVDSVLHLAARVHLPDDCDERAFRRVNTDATFRLAQAAVQSGVRRFVYLSTVKVLGESSPPGRPWSESDLPSPEDPYARSKLDAEQGLRELAGRLEVVILRPPLLYGPAVGANFLRLLESIDRGAWLPFGAIANRRSLLYVGNLASAIAACLHHPAAAGMTFLVSDGEDVSTPELIRRMASMMGRPARCWPVPVGALWAGAAVARRTNEARRLLGSLAVDSTLIRSRLEWRPPSSLDEGLAATVAWFRGLKAAHAGARP